MSKADVNARHAEAAAARAKFMTTLHEVQHRLHPKTIANDVKEKAKEKADGAVSAAKDGMVQAATHPSTVAAIAVPILLYLFRKPIARGVNALLRRDEKEVEQTPPFEAARTETRSTTQPVRAGKPAPAEQGA